MSDTTGDHRSGASREEEGVLVNLPRTRPQRSSPRRAAARAAAAGRAGRREPIRTAGRSKIGGIVAAGGTRRPATARAAAGKRVRSAAKRQPDYAHRRQVAPRQGFESEAESMSGSVQPPGGAELVASAAELLGELAKVGLSTGERLFKDVLSRLPRS
jgi:hypothetical protein